MQTLLEEIHFKCERPALDVFVVVLQVWIIGNGLKLGRPAVMAGKKSCESGFSTSYISGYSDVHNFTKFVKVY